MTRKITNEELIQDVQSLAEKLGRTPKRREFTRNQAAKYRFGSWNNFLKKAGLILLKEFDLSIEDYENIIHDFVKKHGHTPTSDDFYNDVYLPDPRAMERKFKKTWSEILINLGYKPNIRMNSFANFTDEEILGIVKAELNRIGSTKMIDYRNNRSTNAPSEKFLRNRLNIKWNDMLKLLNLEINIEQRSKEEWLNLLKDIAKDLGRTPSIRDLEIYKLDGGVYKYNFGSYNNALKEAGLEPNKTPSEVSETDEELFNMYLDLCKKLNRAATANDIDLNLHYSNDVFSIRFGGINNLKRLAGYDILDFHKKFTKESITEVLKKAYKINDRRLTIKEMLKMSKEDEAFPSTSTVCRYFKTTKISDVWNEIEKDN